MGNYLLLSCEIPQSWRMLHNGFSQTAFLPCSTSRFLHSNRSYLFLSPIHQLKTNEEGKVEWSAIKSVEKSVEWFLVRILNYILFLLFRSLLVVMQMISTALSRSGRERLREMNQIQINANNCKQCAIAKCRTWCWRDVVCRILSASSQLQLRAPQKTVCKRINAYKFYRKNYELIFLINKMISRITENHVKNKRYMYIYI